MALSDRDTAQLRAALQESIVKCSERCLYRSAKWAAELLDAIPVSENEDDSQMTEIPSYGQPPIVLTGNVDPEEAALEAKEINKYLFAKSLFDCKEYDRCAAVFLPDSILTRILSSPANPHTPQGKGKARASAAASRTLPVLSQKSLFLALYAKYMSGEKQKSEESEMVMGPHDGGHVINKQLVPVSRYLDAWFQERIPEVGGEAVGSQGWLEYLYGMVLAKAKNNEEAMKWLIRSVQYNPMNWGCWLEIAGLIERVEDLNRLSPHLPQNILSFIFHIHVSVELYQSDGNMYKQLSQLLGIFPSSGFLLMLQALLSYHSKDFATAEQQFSSLLALHPHRLDGLEHYSNILYVMNMRPKLAFLAHLCTSLDRFRPETCVVVGNYYSILSQHEKAVTYFRRALYLDRSCVSAWILMGHEYVELKNTHAAIEAYRRATDVNRRDHRGWYGLGQTYEMLEMHQYAVWYYKRAASLRPWDGKMWMAVGSCYQKLGQDEQGIKALKRALVAESYYDSGAATSFGSQGDRYSNLDPEILLQIAGMYERLGDEDEARGYMEMCIEQEEGPSQSTDLGVSVQSQEETDKDSDTESVGGRRKSKRPSVGSADAANGGGGGGGGVGVTAATSKARMWLAKYSMRHAEFERAMQLATELCQDGVEVEEAKALIREVRARGEVDSGS